jgi:pimeloyl-ACP methyl ester carboxylesterase
MSREKSRLSFICPIPTQPEFPLLLFLPGMDGTGQLYQKQAKRLAPFFDIRCLSIPPDDMSDWDILARDAIALIKQKLLLEQRNWDEKLPPPPLYVCGESFGGCLALKIALEAPWLFEKIVLVNPASSFNQRIWLGWGVQITQWMPDWLHQGSTLTLLPFLAALERIAPSERRELLKAMNSVPPRVASWRLSLLKDFSVSDRDLTRIKQPTLILAGGRDGLLPSRSEAKRLIHFLPNANVVSLPDSGHACLIENDVFLDKILIQEHFLDESYLSSDRQTVV